MFAKAAQIYQQEGTDGLLRRVQRKYRLTSVMTSAYGIRLATNFDDGTFNMYLDGTYGWYYWDHLSGLDAAFVFVDIGANQGLYTICAAQNPACVKSHAFEPVVKTHHFLTRNIALNNLTEKCETHQAAISNTQGVAQLRMNSAHSGGATIQERQDGSTGFDRSLEIQTVNHVQFDALIGDDDLPLVVKVDVEGFEATVLAELMASRHAARITEIFYEVDERWVDATVLQALLERHGFCTFEKIGQNTTHYDVMARR